MRTTGKNSNKTCAYSIKGDLQQKDVMMTCGCSKFDSVHPSMSSTAQKYTAKATLS